MEPRIQYAQTSDGANIAFWTLGQGAPLVWVPAVPLSHVRFEWQVPLFRQPYEFYAATHQLIRYDSRGTGLSDRRPTDFSIEAQETDLRAVIDRLKLEKVALLAGVRAGPAAIAFAAHNPERVSHLILVGAYARTSDYAQSPQLHALAALMARDWQLFARTGAHFMFDPGQDEEERQYTQFILESISQEAMLEYSGTAAAFDVSDLLPAVRCPTLVIDHPRFSWLSPDVSRSLAARIPDARLSIMEADSRDIGAGLGISEFLESTGAKEGAGQDDPPQGEVVAAGAQGAFRTVLFTDVVGHTEMMQRLGDERGRDVLREHERITRETLKKHGGAEVKTMGDGFLASFGSVTSAMECAIALQRAFAERNETAPEPVIVRVGLNAGEPIEEDGDLFGATVILASRIAAQAGGGEILIPEPVRHLLSGKSYVYADRGETLLKGFEDAVRLYEVRWRE